jgi:hypothetical protein
MKPVAAFSRLLIGVVVLGCQTTKTPAVTAEVAKACSLLLEKAFPPREPGNPAAGSSAGSGEEQRRYFAKCVANGGHVDDNNTKAGK